MGDQCVKIAKLVRLTAGLPADPPMVMVLEEMAARALQMTRAALDCLSRRDQGGAAELDTLDELIDDLNRGITRRVIDLDAKPELREAPSNSAGRARDRAHRRQRRRHRQAGRLPGHG